MALTSPGAGRSLVRALGLLLTLCAGGAVMTFATPESSRTAAHTVVRGDSLWSLALKSHTTVTRLQALNGLHGETILLGQTLQLPAPAPAASATPPTTPSATPPTTPPTTPAYSAASIGASLGALRTQAIPSHLLAQQYIRTEALRQGVPPSLALAVAYQESGFSQGMVSPTNAVGIMQLEPGTADWVGTYLVGRTLNRYNAYDNVVGGVALLRNLLAQADTPTAVAGYYEGLKAVRERGLFTDTRAYVASVLALQSRFS